MAESHVEVDWYGDDLLKRIESGSDDALFETAKVLAKEFEVRVPVKTGNLKRSIYATGKAGSTYEYKRGYKKEVETKKGLAATTASAPHSHLLEFGTRKMPPQPYMRPSLDSAKNKLGEKFVAELGKDLK